MLTPSFPAIPGQQVIINAIASSVAPITNLVVMFNGQPLALNSNGRGDGHRRQSGSDADHGDGDRRRTAWSGQRRLTCKVRDPNDTTPPSFPSTAPCLMPCCRDRPQFWARLPTRNLDSWTLEIATPNNPEFTVLATGTTPVNDGTLAQLDPAELANGFYQLRLTATDMSGRTTTTTAQIEINTPTKPSDMVVTDADLSVNLDGTTVLIERSYDPLNRDGSGDFGSGWSLVNRQTNLQTNVAATGQEDFGVFNPFGDGTAIYPDAAHRPAGAIHVCTDELRGRRPDVLPARLAGRLRCDLYPASRPMPCSRRRAAAITTWRPASRTTPAIRSSAARATR